MYKFLLKHTWCMYKFEKKEKKEKKVKKKKKKKKGKKEKKERKDHGKSRNITEHHGSSWN